MRPGDCISRFAGEYKTFWEFELLEELAMRGPRGGIFVDAGANVGTHSVYFAKFLCDHVVAIEPHPALCKILRRNLEANRLSNYTIVQKAVAQERWLGKLVPAEVGFAEDSQRNRVLELADGEQASESEDLVATDSLDHLLDELRPELGGRRVTFLKLDIEGMELDALKGARNLLASHKPQLAVEANTLEERSAVSSFLADFGYREVGQFVGTPTFHFIDPSVHLVRPERWSLAAREAHRLELATRDIANVVPSSECLVLVDEEQWGMGDHVAGRRRMPFPERDGVYWGKPADDAAAILECERLRQLQAHYLVFAWPAFWWLDHFAAFQRHLRERYPCVLENDRLIIFDLRP